MFFTTNQVRALNEDELVKFLDRRISESTGLVDYKRDLSTTKNKDQENRELLKDVSGFANAEGGHLMIGMVEPTLEGQGAACLLGIDEGSRVATEIEQRCAAAIDPRIPGLLAHVVPLKNGKDAVIIHIPPSPTRPHMVAYEPTKTRTFFIRHSETTQPMKSSEVRQAVLSAASGTQDAIDYAAEQEKRLHETSAQFARNCFVLLQATPLVPVEVLWDVTGTEWRNLLGGSHRQAHDRAVTLQGAVRLPTLEGVAMMADSGRGPSMMYEVHRNGYIGASIVVDPNSEFQDGTAPYFWGSHSDLFLAFGDLCDDAVRNAQSDRPYVLQASITNCARAVLQFERRAYSTTISKPLTRNHLRFPPLRRDSGQSFVDAVQPWTPTFFNAFGVDYKE